MTADLTVRRATATDAGRIHALMRALAEHEGLAPYLAATPDSLAQALSAQPPRAAFLLAEIAGRAAGFVSWTRSTASGEVGTTSTSTTCSWLKRRAALA